MKLLKYLLLISVLIGSPAVLTSCKKGCKKDPCKNGGTCVDGTCNCPNGFEGETCDTEVRGKFYGTYNGLIDCTVGPDLSAGLVIRAGSSGATSIVIDDGSAPINCTLSGNSFTVNSGQGITGSGQFNGNTLNWNYVFSGTSCNFTGTK